MSAIVARPAALGRGARPTRAPDRYPARIVRPFRSSSLRGRFCAALILAALAIALLPHGSPAQSQPRRSEVIRERLKTRPGDPTLYYFLAAAEYAEGDRAAGLAALEQLLALGNGFLPLRDMFETAWDDSAFQEVRGRLEKKLPKVTAAREAFRLDRGLIPEGIAYDPRSRSYFVGSIAQHKIVRVDSAGAVSDFSKPGELRNVLGLAIDRTRRRLHAVSATLVDGPADSANNRVVTYDLATGALVRSVAIPAAAQLNDVTVAPGGDLYTTDSRAGGVFRIRAGSGAVDTLVARGTLPGVNGLALSSDGAALYLGHTTGVARLELATGELLPRIEIPAGETIAAIDGLYADGNTLLGVQNLTNPGRVIRIHLRADGKGADRIETLLSHHHPALDEPTTGAVVGRSFALLATTQVARFTPQGKIASPETVKPPVVLLIPLDGKRDSGL